MSSPRKQPARARVKLSPENNRPESQSTSLESSLLKLINDHQNTATQLREHTGRFVVTVVELKLGFVDFDM